MQHCDPAGIVFTPQYFNLFIEVVEDWFGEALNYSFPEMVGKQRQGLPAMRIMARFRKPSYHGDDLQFFVSVLKLRRNNALVSIVARSGGEIRCEIEILFGFAALETGGLTTWPEQLYQNLKAYTHANSE